MTKSIKSKKADITPSEKKEVTDKKTLPCMKFKKNKEGIEIELISKPTAFIGTGDFGFEEGFIRQLVNASTPSNSTDAKGANFMLSVVEGIKPKDQVEAMLASQMAAVQMATMTFARKLAHSENMFQYDIALRGFTKLTRTFTAQVEALKKYRSNGQQTVTVEHVTVNEGGQAIVGHVDQGGGGSK